MNAPQPSDYHTEFASIYDEVRTNVISVSTDIDLFLQCNPLKKGARVLDFGCGTGVHALELAARGYDVTGVDISPGMIERARQNCRRSVGTTMFCGPISVYRLPPGADKFDGFFSFANVLNCLPDRQAMADTLSGIAALMRSGARGLVDLWNVEPLLRHGPQDTVRHVQVPGAQFVQTMHPTFDPARHALSIEYRIFVSRDDANLWRQVTSTHHLRLLRLDEYSDLFTQTGFRVIDVLSQRPRSAARTDANHRLVCYLVERI